MSRNQRRRKTHSKNKKNKNFAINYSLKLKKKYLKIISNFRNKLVIHDLFENIKLKSRKNKKNIIFAMFLFLVVSIGYFIISYNPDGDILITENESDNTISINLSEETKINVENTSDEIKNIALISDNEIINTDKIAEKINDRNIEKEVAVIKRITEDKISRETLDVTLKNVNENKIYQSVSKSIMLGIDMYAIIVNGEEIAYLEFEEEAEKVLFDLEEKYKNEDAISEKLIFKEDISVEKVKRDVFDFDGYKTPEEILEYIIKGTNEQRIHKVVSGENFWVIASDYGLNVQDLIDANPNIEERKLQIGTELSLIVAEPIINIIAISQVERVDQISFGKDPNVKTDAYYVGDYRIKRNGVKGEAEVVAEVYMENGKLIGEKIIESIIIKEPINKIVYEGTKPAPPRIGTGTFQQPTSRGYLTSPFGPRWGSFHNGIDIGISEGTDVYAADGGVVIWSGWQGTYGKLIIIDHGANIHSYYGHLSTLKVGAGEKVFKGQTIALSGNTGRSTGPHLHFEVRKNGVPQNPMNYVKY